MPFEPWVLLRLGAGLVALCLFARCAWVAARVLRFGHVASTSEGQLALERQAELSAAAARVGAVVQVLSLLLTAIAADRMTSSVRGAMCGYGVVHANEAGPWSVAATLGAALAAGAYWQLLRLDRAHRSLSLLRPVSWGALALACASALDFGFALEWLGGLDLKAVSSCCSSGADAAGEALGRGAGGGARVLATAGALAALPAAAAALWWAARRAGRGRALGAGALALVAVAIGAAAAVLEVAPHVYEVPHHRCPYCLFRADAWGIGYPLFGALFVAAVAALGATAGALLTRRAREPGDPFARFAAPLLRRAAVALAVALALGAAPVVRFALLSGGASLFAGAPLRPAARDAGLAAPPRPNDERGRRRRAAPADMSGASPRRRRFIVAAEAPVLRGGGSIRDGGAAESSGPELFDISRGLGAPFLPARS